MSLARAQPMCERCRQGREPHIANRNLPQPFAKLELANVIQNHKQNLYFFVFSGIAET